MDYQVHLFVARSAFAKCWRFVEGVQAEGEIWKVTYTSYAKGAPQDTHFKFYMEHTKQIGDGPNTSPACNACGKTESLAHGFFECEEAYKIWREIKPKLNEILDGKNIQCFMFTQQRTDVLRF